jgi:hypothetical protein
VSDFSQPGPETAGSGFTTPGDYERKVGERLAAERALHASPLTVQVGGDHYKTMKIQPLEFILANDLPFPEGCVVKYVSRWRTKNGVEDLRKARHYIDVLIEQAEAGNL